MSVSARIIIAIYVPFVHFTYSLHLYSVYFVFLLTAVPCSCWPLTSNRQGQIFQLRLAGELRHLRMWASSTLGTKTPTHVTSHTQPLGRRQGDPVGESPGMLENLNPKEWRWRCVGLDGGWHQQGMQDEHRCDRTHQQLQFVFFFSILALQLPGLCWNGRLWLLQSSA